MSRRRYPRSEGGFVQISNTPITLPWLIAGLLLLAFTFIGPRVWPDEPTCNTRVVKPDGIHLMVWNGTACVTGPLAPDVDYVVGVPGRVQP